jgi:hypothetical protein
MMWTSNNGCVANQLIGRCDNRGVMTISFSKPVTNPVVSFAGWGGGSNGAGWSEMQLLGGMNGTSPVSGARFTALSGTNIEVSQNGTVVGNVGTTFLQSVATKLQAMELTHRQFVGRYSWKVCIHQLDSKSILNMQHQIRDQMVVTKMLGT